MLVLALEELTFPTCTPSKASQCSPPSCGAPWQSRPAFASTIWTHPRTHLTPRDIKTFNAQYPVLEVQHTTDFHDRFLVIDGAEGYLVGASLKDTGKRTFAITRIEDEALTRGVLEKLETAKDNTMH